MYQPIPDFLINSLVCYFNFGATLVVTKSMKYEYVPVSNSAVVLDQGSFDARHTNHFRDILPDEKHIYEIIILFQHRYQATIATWYHSSLQAMKVVHALIRMHLRYSILVLIKYYCCRLVA